MRTKVLIVWPATVCRQGSCRSMSTIQVTAPTSTSHMAPFSQTPPGAAWRPSGPPSRRVMAAPQSDGACVTSAPVGGVLTGSA